MEPIELVTISDPELPSFPVCPSGPHYGTCSLGVALDDPDPHGSLAEAYSLLVAKAELRRGEPPRWTFVDPSDHQPCECVIVHGISTDGPPLDFDDPAVIEAMQYSPYGTPAEYAEACAEDPEPDLEPTSYLGGVLYRNGLFHNGVCSGLNLYYGEGDTVSLRPGAAPPTAVFPELVGCQADTLLNEVDLAVLEAEGFACEPNEQMLAYSLHDGQLVRTIGSTWGPEASACTCASWLPVSPDLCPSPLDPCGRGEGFGSREGWQERWVTTDERFALARDAEGLAILAADRTAPLRRVPLEDSTILGVEYHRDTQLLGVAPPPDAVSVRIPARHESDAGFDGTAAAWGNRCFAHLEADRLDAAEAACFAGLLEGGTDGTRGALTYNLGRIAEARGDRETARAYYQRSPRLRPHASTAERLQALGGS